MSGIEGVGGRVHLRPEDDETTTAIVRRDTKAAISGNDATWREMKTEHQEHVGVAGGAELAVTGLHINEIGGIVHLGAAGAIGGAFAALGLGIYSLHEAHEKGDAQKAALARDNAHVAVIFNLALPPSYSNKRLNGDYKHVQKDKGPAFDQMRAIQSDTKGRAVLQLHADRGMNAARDLTGSGMTRDAFMKANPKIADQCAKDAAFKEGFDAYVFTKQHCTIDEGLEMDRQLDLRDGWYAQDHVSIRV